MCTRFPEQQLQHLGRMCLWPAGVEVSGAWGQGGAGSEQECHCGENLLPRCHCQVSVLSTQVNTLENSVSSKRQVAEGSHLCAVGSPLARQELAEEGGCSCTRPGAQASGAWLKRTWSALVTLFNREVRTDFFSKDFFDVDHF